MSFPEKRNILNIISNVIISAFYYNYMYHSYISSSSNTEELLQFWATSLLIYVPVMIVSTIVIHIVFTIIDKIRTQEKFHKSDERDKLIELKSTRIAQYLFGLGFLIAMSTLASGMSVNTLFIVLISSGVVSSIAENFSQLYFYRRGF